MTTEIERLQNEIAAAEIDAANKRQELRRLELAGAFYVLNSPGRGYYDAARNLHADPSAAAVTKFASPRAALESLPDNPTNADPTIQRVINGVIDSTFHADYIIPNNRRASNWPDDWKFYDERGEVIP